MIYTIIALYILGFVPSWLAMGPHASSNGYKLVWTLVWPVQAVLAAILYFIDWSLQG
jgi:hypothetical protein